MVVNCIWLDQLVTAWFISVVTHTLSSLSICLSYNLSPFFSPFSDITSVGKLSISLQDTLTLWLFLPFIPIHSNNLLLSQKPIPLRICQFSVFVHSSSCVFCSSLFGQWTVVKTVSHVFPRSLILSLFVNGHIFRNLLTHFFSTGYFHNISFPLICCHLYAVCMNRRQFVFQTFLNILNKCYPNFWSNVWSTHKIQNQLFTHKGFDIKTFEVKKSIFIRSWYNKK